MTITATGDLDLTPAPVEVAEESRARTTLGTLARFIRREPLVAASFVVLAIIVFVALVPGLLAGYQPLAQNLDAARAHPSLSHLFGTDELGRDVFSRVLYGAHLSLFVGVVAALIGAIVGGFVGLAAGYAGKIIDATIMRFTDVMLAFPGMLLALAIIAGTGPSIRNLVIAVGIGNIAPNIRLMRGQVLALRERPFIESAVAAGSRRRTILFGHLLPNAASPVVVLTTLGVGFSLLTASGLSFIGLGAQPPSPEWGAMLADGTPYLQQEWWIGVFPGLAILLTVLSITVIGQWLRDRLDPRGRQS
jgi:peptide/nickel transport system permease protein